MATIDDLPFKSISEMTDDELMESIRSMRLRRSTAQQNPTKVTTVGEKKKATARKVASKALDLSKTSDILAGLTPEQRAELLKELSK